MRRATTLSSFYLQPQTVFRAACGSHTHILPSLLLLYFIEYTSHFLQNRVVAQYMLLKILQNLRVCGRHKEAGSFSKSACSPNPQVTANFLECLLFSLFIPSISVTLVSPDDDAGLPWPPSLMCLQGL